MLNDGINPNSPNAERNRDHSIGMETSPANIQKSHKTKQSTPTNPTKTADAKPPSITFGIDMILNEKTSPPKHSTPTRHQDHRQHAVRHPSREEDTSQFSPPVRQRHQQHPHQQQQQHQHQQHQHPQQQLQQLYPRQQPDYREHLDNERYQRQPFSEYSMRSPLSTIPSVPLVFCHPFFFPSERFPSAGYCGIVPGPSMPNFGSYHHHTEPSRYWPSHENRLDGAGQKRKRRHRTIFNEFQLEKLEETFRISAYPDVNLREELSNQLELKEERVEVWFKNRRAKNRKQMAEKSAAVKNAASATSDNKEMVQDDETIRREFSDRKFTVLSTMQPSCRLDNTISSSNFSSDSQD